jgi:hypothetical protein
MLSCFPDMTLPDGRSNPWAGPFLKSTINNRSILQGKARRLSEKLGQQDMMRLE